MLKISSEKKCLQEICWQACTKLSGEAILRKRLLHFTTYKLIAHFFPPVICFKGVLVAFSLKWPLEDLCFQDQLWKMNCT